MLEEEVRNIIFESKTQIIQPISVYFLSLKRTTALIFYNDITLI